jgi:hypothetical protein
VLEHLKTIVTGTKKCVPHDNMMWPLRIQEHVQPMAHIRLHWLIMLNICWIMLIPRIPRSLGLHQSTADRCKRRTKSSLITACRASWQWAAENIIRNYKIQTLIDTYVCVPAHCTQ